VILYCDDYLRFTNSIDHPSYRRFLIISSKLPQELQTILCLVAYRLRKRFIKRMFFESSFKRGVQMFLE